MLASASQSIRMWKPQPDFVEQSSDDIWNACCTATKAALKLAEVSGDAVMGIGFDATCSLVALDAKHRPLTVSPTERHAQNVVVWMDHRAVEQAERINGTRHEVLKYVGGVISPEMQMPKLLWIKEHLPATWKKATLFFDLPDFLTFRATGDTTRSLCSTVCKWNYQGHAGTDEKGWSVDFLKRIKLADLTKDHFSRIGNKIRPMGESLGKGLLPKAAMELGLRPGIAVGVSIIDAHAGGLGLLGARLKGHGRELRDEELSGRLALIGGTSTCHMTVSRKPTFIPGIWGPYFSAMIPGYWLTEGGQSATGALIDHVIASHAAAPELRQLAQKSGKTVYQVLNERLEVLAKIEKATHPAELTKDFHIQPDFHGNRSPRANPTLKGMMVGLTLSQTVDDLARQYLAAVQAVAYGTRHILEEINRKGHPIRELFICGGGTKNPVFLREHADITGCRLVLPKEPEAVLLGAAVLGAVASRTFPSVLAAMRVMNVAGRVIEPSKGSVAQFHRRKYEVFLRLHNDFMSYRNLMGV